ncbi:MULTISPECIES: radical SAM protein [Acidobacteriaceae]|uniref:radical SAM protein n=1 Tax=Acidobacteriaceae TaxID=204434 RepID=UPI002110B232|nr:MULTISPECIES: radical SAM protein [Acidobacteriaceae]MDW5266116.1 radical SAM protein [Edaphobacter sp.]
MLGSARYTPPAAPTANSTRTRAFLRTFVVDSLLLKLCSRCNINCTYCYWFRDGSAYSMSKLLTRDAEKLLLRRLEQHIIRYQLKHFAICFHGGEPLLFGKRRFGTLCSSLRRLQESLACSIDLTIQTNGILIDEEWCSLFRYFRVSPSLSLDGPGELHDHNRIDHVGRGTYSQVVTALHLLQSEGFTPGVLAVCNPGSSAADLCNHFVKDLNVRWFDVLFPDVTHHDIVRPVASYFKDLFDRWYDDLRYQGITIRVAENLLLGVLGRRSTSESLGLGPLTTFAITPDGSFELCDVFHSVGLNAACAGLNLASNNLQEIVTSPRWVEVLNASLDLAGVCKRCRFYSACGGGYVPNRWSNEMRYDNPSAYCSDLQDIFRHVSNRVLSSGLPQVTVPPQLEQATL